MTDKANGKETSDSSVYCQKRQDHQEEQEEEEEDQSDISGIIHIFDEESGEDEDEEAEDEESSEGTHLVGLLPPAPTSSSSSSSSTSEFTCETCSYSAPSFEALFVHMAVHKVLRADDESNSGDQGENNNNNSHQETQFTACPHGCGWVPGSKRRWRRHMDDCHTMERYDVDRDDADGQVKAGRFACSKCPFSHRFIGVVKVHEAMAHSSNTV